MVLVLFLFQSLDLRVASLNFLVDKFHTLSHVLSALFQFLAHQHGSVQFVDLQWEQVEVMFVILPSAIQDANIGQFHHRLGVLVTEDDPNGGK